MAEERFVLTKDGYEDLKQELADLESQYKEQFQNLADVHDQRDSSEEGAASYDTEVSAEDTEQRIGHLKLVLEHADVVGDEDPHPHRVDPGERVTVWNVARRRVEKFDLRGSEEVINERPQLDDKGPTSVAIDSPVGKALLGRRVGDVITVEVPDGKTRYTVRKIERIPSR